jgi:hypothetical protein
VQVDSIKSRVESAYGICYAVLVGGANGDGAWRGLATIAESINPHPYIFQPAVYGWLFYTVIYTGDRLLTKKTQIPV